MWESFRDKEMRKIITFLLLFYYLQYGKNSLFSCCIGYIHAIFTIIFMNFKLNILEGIYKRKNGERMLMTFIAVLLLFYDLKCIIQETVLYKSSMVPEVTVPQI